MNILVTAGPTREPIDPVRFISNRSSGKMGYAIAAAAVKRGHKVVLVSGPVLLQPPSNEKVMHVITAEQMRRAVRRKIRWCDALIMAAAVADWRPTAAAKKKIKKGKRRSLRLELTPTIDILRDVRPLKGRRLYVGFAAETGAPQKEAARKLNEKGLDLIVANDVSGRTAGFETDTNRVILLAADGTREAWPLMSKARVGMKLVRRIERSMRDRRATPAARGRSIGKKSSR